MTPEEEHAARHAQCSDHADPAIASEIVFTMLPDGCLDVHAHGYGEWPAVTTHGFPPLTKEATTKLLRYLAQFIPVLLFACLCACRPALPPPDAPPISPTSMSETRDTSNQKPALLPPAPPPAAPQPANYRGFLGTGLGAGAQYRNAMEGWAAGELATQGKQQGPRKVKTTGTATAIVGDANKTNSANGKGSASGSDSSAPQAVKHADNVTAPGGEITQYNPPKPGLNWWWLLLVPGFFAVRWTFNRLNS